MNLVAHHAGRAIHPKIFAIDGGARLRTHALPAHGTYRRGWPVHIEHDLFGHPVNGQVAGDLHLPRALRRYLRRLERNRRILGYVEKIRTAQVVVAPFDPGVYRCGINGRINLRFAGVGGIVDYRARRLLKYSPDGRDAEVLNRKLRGAVVGVDLPRGRLSGGRNSHSQKGKAKDSLHMLMIQM